MSKTFGKKTILINSAYRSNPNSSSTTDFTYTFPETVRNVVHTNLLTAVIENGVYNVVAGVNDTFQMSFINYNTPVVSATFVSPSTQTMPFALQNITFAGTTANPIYIGALVNITETSSGSSLAKGIILPGSSGTVLIVGLTSLTNGGSVVAGFTIEQYDAPNCFATSTTSNNWNEVNINQTLSFTTTPGTGTFQISNTQNVVVVNSANNTVVGTASLTAFTSTTLTLRVATVQIPSTALATWTFYQSSSIPNQTVIPRTITLLAKYYDLESLVSNIQDRINSSIPSIPSQWNLPHPISATKFTAKIDSQGYFYLSNDDTPNWAMNFPQVGAQELLGFAPLFSIAPALPGIGPVQLNNPYEIVSPDPMSIYNYDILLVQSDRLGNSITSAQGFDCWWVIPNTNSQNNSTTITYENTRHPLLETAWKVPRDLEFIDIRLLDKSGKVVDIGTNDIQLVVECFTDDSARR